MRVAALFALGLSIGSVAVPAPAEACGARALRLRARCADVRRSCLCERCPPIDACGGDAPTTSCGDAAYDRCQSEYDICADVARRAFDNLCRGGR